VSDELEEEVAGLRRLSRQQLKDRWRDLYKAAPPKAFTPDLLARGIAWRLQEKELGGLAADVQRQLTSGGEGAPLRRHSPARVALRTGNRLVRRWRGRIYVVEVTEGGLVYEQTSYASLSVIATTITGTRWSGPKFFGLVG
jgi:hypothetical protein